MDDENLALSQRQGRPFSRCFFSVPWFQLSVQELTSYARTRAVDTTKGRESEVSAAACSAVIVRTPQLRQSASLGDPDVDNILRGVVRVCAPRRRVIF